MRVRTLASSNTSCIDFVIASPLLVVPTKWWQGSSDRTKRGGPGSPQLTLLRIANPAGGILVRILRAAIENPEGLTGVTMQPLHVFIDASSMPRDLSRPNHAVEQLAELRSENLVQVHMSEIAAREWRSRLVDEFIKHVLEMQTALRKVKRQTFAKALKHHKIITLLVDEKQRTIAEAEKAILTECEKLSTRLDILETKIDGKDAVGVFHDYFAGEAPFRAPKCRDDLPDAFILRAAKLIVARLGNEPLLAVCYDQRLREALGKISGIKVFENLFGLYESECAKGAMQHLELARVWNEKKEAVLAFLREHPERVEEVIDEFVTDTLQGYQFSDSAIPVDNSEAFISHAEGAEDIEVEWENAKGVGPGWLLVPFKFETDADLDLFVFRMDAFSMPKWIEVTIGDFETDHYFEANANRRLKVSGELSFLFTKEDLTAPVFIFPESVEIEEVEVGLVHNRDEEEYWD
jgi:PIN domain